MMSFLGQTNIKQTCIKRVIKAFAEDKMTATTEWWQERKDLIGIAVGGNDEGFWEKELGIPRDLALVANMLWEELPRESNWPENFLSAMPMGVDLSGVVNDVIADQFTDPIWGLNKLELERKYANLIKLVEKQWKKMALRQKSERWEDVSLPDLVEVNRHLINSALKEGDDALWETMNAMKELTALIENQWTATLRKIPKAIRWLGASWKSRGTDGYWLWLAERVFLTMDDAK